MSAIGPGDYVQIVSHEPQLDPEHGLVCRVVAIMDDDDCDCHYCGGVTGAVLDGDGHGILYDAGDPFAPWCLCELRPIYRPRADLIESLLAPLPEHVLEQA